MAEYWLWLLLAGAGLCWLASLLAVRYWTRKKLLGSLAVESLASEDIPLPFANPRPEDQQALQVIRDFRRRCLLKLWPDTEFSLKALNGLTLELIQQIAAAYHPEEERPELQASLAEVLSLQTRISVRLQALLETLPLRALKDVDLKTILFCHNIYKQCTTHPVYQFFRHHHLDTLARWAWMLKNYASPWYWGGRAAYAGGKEMLARFFLARMATIVGVEAIRLYSGRSPGAEAWRKYDLAIQEMLYVAATHCVSAGEALKSGLQLVLNSQELPEQVKLRLVERLTRMSATQPADFRSLSPADKTQLGRWLKKFILQVAPPGEQKLWLREMRQRLAASPNDQNNSNLVID